MVKTCARTLLCAVNKCFFLNLFTNLRILLDYSSLNHAEKCVLRWLATECAMNVSHACNVSYEELSLALNLPCKTIHRALFRLRIMGFLHACIPIWYWKLTPEMCHTKRELSLICFQLNTLNEK